MKLNNKYKIAYIGGPDLSLRIPFVKRLIASGFDVCCIGSNKEEELNFSENNLTYFYYPLSRNLAILFFCAAISLYRLYSILRRENIQIVHAFGTKPAVFGRIAARLARVPIVVGTVPGLGSLFSEDSLKHKLLRLMYILAQKVACNISDATVFQNKAGLQLFLAKRIAPPAKFVVIRGSGVDESNFSSEREQNNGLTDLKAELGIIRENLVVSMISRIGKFKGVNEYLQAAKIVKTRHREVQFFLVGPKDHNLIPIPDDVMKEYKPYVNYIGFRKDIPEMLNITDIVVLPSYYGEGIPRILLEAACMEKPIITTNNPGCSDVVEAGFNGLLIPPRDTEALAKALEKLISNAELRIKMGKNGRIKVVKEFSQDVVLNKTLELYNSLIIKKGISS